MKFAMIFLVAVAAVAPPRISLNLEGMTNAYRLKASITRNHDLSWQQNDGTAVMSRQDWTEKCPAKRKCAEGQVCATTDSSNWVTTTRANCPFPVAKGYDHQDKEVEVITRIFLVDEEGVPKNTEVHNTHTGGGNVDDTVFTQAMFDKRSTYLFKYDAQDKAGNKAEQVVFALILDDSTAPIWKADCHQGHAFVPAITVEAVSDWELCQSDAFDNIDNIDRDDVIYAAQYLNHNREFQFRSYSSQTHPAAIEGKTWAETKAWFSATCTDNLAGSAHSTCVTGRYLVTTTVYDRAGVYGHNAMNNKATRQQAILVRDRTAPTILLAGSDPTYQECWNNNKRWNQPTDANVNGAHRVYRNNNNGWSPFEGYPGFHSECVDKLDTEALGHQLATTTTIKTCSGAESYYQCETGSVYTTGTTAHDSSQAHPFNWQLANQVRNVGTRQLEYSCQDFAGNNATKRIRTVHTVDTTEPTLILAGDSDIINYVVTNTSQNNHKTAHGNNNGRAGEGVWNPQKHLFGRDPGFTTARDACDIKKTANDVVVSWGPRYFNAKKLGDYVRTYKLTDESGNTATRFRTFTVIDEDIPVITRMGPSQIETVEASRDHEYTDKGATCHDFIDGELSHAVEVSGEVVNMRIPGSYIIQYDCQDLSGNPANAVTRTVVVEDTTIPVITLLGANVNYVEAGFPYVDGGATATDTLDGDITQYIWTDGNTVDVNTAWYTKRSCQEIKNQIHTDGGNAQDLSGDYYITTLATGGVSGNAGQAGTYQRVKVHCLFIYSPALTWYVHSIDGHSQWESSAPDCASMGLEKVGDAPLDVKTKIKNHLSAISSSLAGDITNHPLDEWLCTVKHAGGVEDLGSENDPMYRRYLHQHREDRIGQTWNHRTHKRGERRDNTKATNAEAGHYEIQFHVEDKAGNHAVVKTRTVIVKDTLPPVITLHLKGKLVHTGAGGNLVGISHNRIGGLVANNPQHNTNGIPPVTTSNPSGGWPVDAQGIQLPYAQSKDIVGHAGNWMAESATTNGWLIGAVASAVAGVALLGLSAKKSATSVPV